MAKRRPRSVITGVREAGRSALHHLLEELLVVLRARHLLEQKLDRLDLGHVAEEVAKEVNAIELFLREEQLLFSRARPVDVDCREHAAVGNLASQDELHVAGALELLEDYLVH